jgi:hypothetical protein
MIQAFKRGFMGVIDLLLNAPYKIDSMVWMRMMFGGFWFVYSVICSAYMAN